MVQNAPPPRPTPSGKIQKMIQISFKIKTLSIFLQRLNKHSLATNHRRRMVDPSLERYYEALIENQHLVDSSMIIYADVSILSALLGQKYATIGKPVSLLYILPVPIFEVVCVCITKVMTNSLLPIVHMEHLKYDVTLP